MKLAHSNDFQGMFHVKQFKSKNITIKIAS